MQVKFEIFRSYTDSWNSLFEQAANFATSIGHEKIINISHSSDGGDGVVAVWYWTENNTTNISGVRETE